MAKKQKKKIYLSQNDTNQLCELSLHDAVNNFLLHCKARGLSDATIRNYRTSSKYFIEFNKAAAEASNNSDPLPVRIVPSSNSIATAVQISLFNSFNLILPHRIQ